MFYMKFIHYFKIRIDISCGDIAPIYTFLVSSADDFIIYISKVLDMFYFIAKMSEIAFDYVPSNEWASITNMRVIVWCNTANINAYLSLF